MDSGLSRAYILPLKEADTLRAIDDDFALLGLNILPHFVALKGSRGRKALFDAMREYYLVGGHKTASRLIQARYEVNRKYGVSQTDIEHFDLSVCYGLLVNTVPCTAWALYHVYSDPLLLAEVRQNIEPLIHQENDQVRIINIPEVIAGCPLLSSLVQEVLRVQSTNASGRVVLKDTLIDNTYLLKKDAILLIPSAELHNSKSAWGPTASTFDPARFRKDHEAQNAHKVPASAYRAFGSGASVCPGRHLGVNEILTVLIMMVVRYDITSIEGDFRMPRTKSHITTSILTPVEDLKVRIRDRTGGAGLRWRFLWKPQKEG